MHIIEDRHPVWARTSRLSLVLSLIVMAVACASAQNGTPTAPIPTLKVTARLIVLDVRVVDASGHFVRGLDRSQFTVYEDRVPQNIVHFEAPLAPAPEAPPVHSTDDLLKHEAPYVNVLVIDELNTPISEIARARVALTTYLEHQPAVLPVPTLFVASGASRLAVLHDFTQDRDDLLAALKAHVTDADFRALSNQLAGGSMKPADGFAKTLGALSQLASSLPGIRGHKNVLWVGSGFDKAYDLTSAGSNDTEAIEAALRTVTARMIDARMSLSTLDPEGMDTQAAEENVDAEATLGGGGNSLTSFSDGISFDELARTTGGAVVHGRNDLFALISTNTAGEFYTITYRPADTSGAAPDFHKIRVVMKNPSLTAITRTGYFPAIIAPQPATPSEAGQQKRQSNFDLLSAASSRLDYTGLHVAASKLSATAFRVQVGANELTWTSAGSQRTADVSVLAVAFDSKGKILAQRATTFHERIKETDQTFGAHITLEVPLNVPHGAQRVRFVVRDPGAGSVGSFELAP
ncbi:MAG TPA: VWA domain-containing protein [Acidobacteriaceae bacterium]|jgi:VWFA-related protein